MQIKWIVDNIRAFSFVLTNWNKEPDKERIYRWGEFFHKLDNTKWKICIVGRMYFSKKKTQNDMSNWNKKPDDEKIYRWTEFFTSWTTTSEKCTRAHMQRNRSIYIYPLSIYLSLWKPFWKRVCIFIYIYKNNGRILSAILLIYILLKIKKWGIQSVVGHIIVVVTG